MCDVYVYIYDLSQDFAQKYSLQLIGQHIDGIWHTGIVVFNREIYFGSGGIESCEPGATVLGNPKIRHKVGVTSKTNLQLNDHIKKLSEDKFHGSQYRLLSHNCNTFSNEIANWLTGNGIPEYVLNLPRTLLNNPIIASFQPYIEAYHPVISAAYIAAKTASNEAVLKEYELTPVLFQEPLTRYAFDVLNDTHSVFTHEYLEMIKTLVDLINYKGILQQSDIFVKLLTEIISYSDKFDIKSKLVFFDIIRLLVANNEEIRLILRESMIDLINGLGSDSRDKQLTEVKFKLICNFIGSMPNERLSIDVITKVKDSALVLLSSRTNDVVASSLIRNIILHRSYLSLEMLSEIGSQLIYLLSVKTKLLDTTTRKNIVITVSVLAKEYDLIKGIAECHEVIDQIQL